MFVEEGATLPDVDSLYLCFLSGSLVRGLETFCGF